MNGPSHYVKGEELAEHAEDLIKQGDPDGLAPVWAALAYVHATLAAAAALGTSHLDALKWADVARTRHGDLSPEPRHTPLAVPQPDRPGRTATWKPGDPPPSLSTTRSFWARRPETQPRRQRWPALARARRQRRDRSRTRHARHALRYPRRQLRCCTPRAIRPTPQTAPILIGGSRAVTAAGAHGGIGRAAQEVMAGGRDNGPLSLPRARSLRGVQSRFMIDACDLVVRCLLHRAERCPLRMLL